MTFQIVMRRKAAQKARNTPHFKLKCPFGNFVSHPAYTLHTAVFRFRHAVNFFERIVPILQRPVP